MTHEDRGSQLEEGPVRSQGVGEDRLPIARLRRIVSDRHGARSSAGRFRWEDRNICETSLNTIGTRSYTSNKGRRY